jgi:hypothetical protein
MPRQGYTHWLSDKMISPEVKTVMIGVNITLFRGTNLRSLLDPLRDSEDSEESAAYRLTTI